MIESGCPFKENMKKNKKNRVTLIMGGTHDYAFAIGNVLIGLEKMSPGLVNRVLVFHNGISEHDQACLRKIRQCDFADYAPPALMPLSGNDTMKRFSLLSFVSYETFRQLEHAEYVLFLDADLVILRDISGLLDYAPLGLKKGGYPLNKSLGPNDYGIDDSVLGPSSGVIIAHESMPWQGLTEQCYELTAKHWNTLHYPDQGIINLVLYRNGIKHNSFPVSFNSSLNDFVPNRHIHHEGFKEKFWNNGIMNLLSPEWEGYDREWRALGGTPYGGKKAMWEFNSMHRNRLNNEFLMAHLYHFALKDFTQSLRDTLRQAGLTAAAIDGYGVRLSRPQGKEVTLGIKVWGKQALAELFVKGEERVERCKAALQRLPAYSSGEVSLLERGGRIWIRREGAITAAFFRDGSGLAFCLEAARELAGIGTQADPEWEEFFRPALSLPEKGAS